MIGEVGEYLMKKLLLENGKHIILILRMKKLLTIDINYVYIYMKENIMFFVYRMLKYILICLQICI